jgi:transposase
MGFFVARRAKRLWSEEEKRSICLQTAVPEVSVAQVARRYALNANLIFKWLRDARFAPGSAQAAADTPCFLPVEIVEHARREVSRTVTGNSLLEFELAGGHRLRIPSKSVRQTILNFSKSLKTHGKSDIVSQSCGRCSRSGGFHKI